MNSAIDTAVSNELILDIEVACEELAALQPEKMSKEYTAIFEWTPISHKDMDGYAVEQYRSKKGKIAEVCIDRNGNVVGNPRYLN